MAAGDVDNTQDGPDPVLKGSGGGSGGGGGGGGRGGGGGGGGKSGTKGSSGVGGVGVITSGGKKPKPKNRSYICSANSTTTGIEKTTRSCCDTIHGALRSSNECVMQSSQGTLVFTNSAWQKCLASSGPNPSSGHCGNGALSHALGPYGLVLLTLGLGIAMYRAVRK